jgi:hypothetical protein
MNTSQVFTKFVDSEGREIFWSMADYHHSGNPLDPHTDEKLEGDGKLYYFNSNSGLYCRLEDQS